MSLTFRLFNKLLLVSAMVVLPLAVSIPSISYAQEKVSISFKDVDIRSVLESVAEITGKTFIVDPRVKGKLTIISNEPVNADLLFDVFLSALQVHGFQAVEDGAIYRILPLSQSYRVPSDGTGGSLNTEIIYLKHTLAQNVVASVRPLLSQGALLQAHVPSNSLIINDTLSQISRIKRILDEIDVPIAGKIETFSLTNIESGEALRIAKELKLDKDTRLNIVEDSANNRILVSGPVELRKPVRELIEKLDDAEQKVSSIDVIYLHYLESPATKTLIEGMLTGGAFDHIAGVKSQDSNKKYSIQEDETTNAIVVAGPPELITSIRRLIKKLDQPRVQVLIEAVIAEVNQDQARDLGAQLAYAGEAGAAVIDFDSALTALASGALSAVGAAGGISSVTNSELASGAGANAGPILSTQGLTFGGFSISDDRRSGFGGFIQSLQTNTNANILSTPSILTLDNEEASISVGMEVPFLTGSFTSTGTGSANPFQTIERREIGIKLTVTPQVNEGDAVRLNILQESSNLLPSAAANTALQQITANRTIQTNVMVHDGELLILGGLLDQSEGQSASKVPLLGDIPLLGNLFKTKSKSKNDNVLMVFIRPTILRSRGEAGQISQKKYNYLTSLQNAKRKENLKKSLVKETMDSFKEPLKKSLNDSEQVPVAEQPQPYK